MEKITIYQRDFFGGLSKVEEHNKSWTTEAMNGMAEVIEDIFTSCEAAEEHRNTFYPKGEVVQDKETRLYLIIKEGNMGLDLNNNPLTGRGKEFAPSPKIIKSTIEKYGELKNINYKLFQKIDLHDREFINRLDSKEEVMNTEGFEGLIESIKGVGLLNPIYLLEKEEGYRIISGWRRSLALSQIFLDDQSRIFREKAIVLDGDTPMDLLEKISIDENIKRKDLSILELSYKFNRFAKKEGITVDDCLKLFTIGKTQFHAIKKAIDFQPEIKEIVEEVGAVKADLLNKIYEFHMEIYRDTPGYDLSKVIEEYKGLSRTELKEILHEAKAMNKAKKQAKTYSVKRNKKKLNITINKSLEDDDYKRLMDFIETLCKA